MPGRATAEPRRSQAPEYTSCVCTDSRQLLVWNCLHPGIGGNNNVARGQVLFKWQPVAKVTVARHCTYIIRSRDAEMAFLALRIKTEPARRDSPS